MADDSWDIDVNMDFYPCDKPHGMKNYVLEDLTPEQQSKLNVRKREEIRTDQKYLKAHPEIRGIIIMILRILMVKRPKRHNIFETIGLYFTKASVDIREEVWEYLREREKILGVSSFVEVRDKSVRSASTSSEELTPEEDMTFEEEVEEQEASVEEEEEFELPESISEEIISQTTIYERELQETKSKEGESICAKIMEEIIDAVIEEIEVPSLESIGSTSVFPVDYDDHAIGSNESISLSIDMNEQNEEK